MTRPVNLRTMSNIIHSVVMTNESMTSHRRNSYLRFTQENDSDNNSNKEFQKMKLQKMDRHKYSARQLVDLEIDCTKSSRAKNSNTSGRREQDIDEQSNLNLSNDRSILRDYKKICLYIMTTYTDFVEQLYGKQDEEQLILQYIEKIDKLRTLLEKKHKDLTVSYQLLKSRKKSCNVVDDDDQSSEEYGERTASEDKHTSGDEEIFSADETRTPQKMRATRHKAGTSETKNNNGINTDDEDKMDESKNSDKNSVDMQDDLITSPVLSTLKEKETKQLNNKSAESVSRSRIT